MSDQKPETSTEEITDLLLAHRRGDPDAFDQLVPLVYEDLRRIARGQLARNRPGATLNTTALVHETYLRLVDQTRIEIKDRGHFYAIAAQSMRRFIIDHVRRNSAAKRGEGKVAISLDEVQVGFADQAEWLLVLDNALDNLSSVNVRLTRVFECRFFAGLTEKETADALELPLRTVQRDWQKGKAWLRRELAVG